jgi:hypothetical protein
MDHPKNTSATVKILWFAEALYPICLNQPAKRSKIHSGRGPRQKFLKKFKKALLLELQTLKPCSRDIILDRVQPHGCR